MHIADATLFWSPRGGGVQTYLRAKQRWFAQRAGWRHSIVAPRCDAPGGVPMDGLCMPIGFGYRIPIGRAATATSIERLAPDLIEAGDPFHVAWAVLDAAQTLDIPAIAFCHSNVIALLERFAGGWTRAATRGYVHDLYSRFASVLAPSNTTAAALRDLGLRNVAVQPLGVDTTMFHPGARDMRWRERIGLPSHARVLLYVGRYAPEKNLETLTDAVRLLGEPYVLVTIGAGPCKPTGERVLRLPYERDKSAVATALASADVVVHAGDQETFGLSALEALACGTPVVARDAAALGEIIDARVGAAVAHAGATEFSQAIDAVARADRETLSHAARARACAYDWQRVMPALAAHYHLIAARHAAHRTADHHAKASVDLYRSA